MLGFGRFLHYSHGGFGAQFIFFNQFSGGIFQHIFAACMGWLGVAFRDGLWGHFGAHFWERSGDHFWERFEESFRCGHVPSEWTPIEPEFHKMRAN